MKIKYIIMILIVALCCGCSNINNENIDDILKNMDTSTKVYNTYHTGYKYYIPTGLEETSYSLFNSIIESDDIKMYLYIDGISYINKSDMAYEENENAYYSSVFEYQKHKGYIEINLEENDKYLIEIMYNYAKIEVMVDDSDINLAVSYAVSILRSISYNDSVIKNLVGDDVLSYQEEVYNIFNTSSSDSNYLKYVEEEQEEEEVIDTDLLN